MKLTTIIIGIGVILIIVAGLFISLCEGDECLVFESQRIKAADSFDRCVDLGFLVMESYPRQCRAGEKLFVEEIKDEGSRKTGSNDLIKITSPLPDQIITSPLVIEGEARGTWYFEASFPVRLFDSEGKELAVSPAEAKEEWMTTDFVPFALTLNFEDPETATGTLIFEKDNPSGLPEHNDSITIPVRFR